MNYLTFEQYQANGGTVELSAFPLLERLARKKLDYWTQGRIREPDCDVQTCMILIINALAEVKQTVEQSVSGYANDGVSVSFSKPARTEAEIMSAVYDQIVEILPVELISVVIR